MTSDASSYVSTPYGLVTAAGRWYHIPEEGARAYAGDVLDHVSLETLVSWADVWVESPRTVTLWALPILLWGLSTVWAAVSALGLYLGWMVLSPVAPRIAAVRMISGLGNVALQGAYYVLGLSVLAVMGHVEAVGLGLAAFVLLRWGVVDWAGRALRQMLHPWLYPLPVTDQVLRALIVQAALKYRVSVPQVDALASDILANWSTRTDAEPDASAPSSSTPK